MKVVDCVRDAKSAIRYVRQNAKRLGIDPDRRGRRISRRSPGRGRGCDIGLGRGWGEAENQLAVRTRWCSSTRRWCLRDAPEADFKVSSLAGVDEHLGAKPETVSPFHNITKGVPPTIVFHGKADTTVPYKTAKAFTAKMKASGNRCELAAEGQAHGFFNYGRGNNKSQER